MAEATLTQIPVLEFVDVKYLIADTFEGLSNITLMKMLLNISHVIDLEDRVTRTPEAFRIGVAKTPSPRNRMCDTSSWIGLDTGIRESRFPFLVFCYMILYLVIICSFLELLELIFRRFLARLDGFVLGVAKITVSLLIHGLEFVPKYYAACFVFEFTASMFC